mgnify:CR=1 FL=1
MILLGNDSVSLRRIYGVRNKSYITKQIIKILTDYNSDKIVISLKFKRFISFIIFMNKKTIKSYFFVT